MKAFSVWIVVLSGMAIVPAAAVAQAPDAKAVLAKAFGVYSGAKTYQGAWSYTLERGTVRMAASMDVQAKAPNRLLVRITPVRPDKREPGAEAVPETLVVIDGKTAWFQNSTAGAYYKVPLPKQAGVSPLLFIPQVSASADVTMKDDKGADGLTVHVLEAPTSDGGATRVEVDPATNRIRRIIHERSVGLVKEVSTIRFDKETFDADVSDRTFEFKPARGAKERPAPPDAAAVFGA